MMPVFGAKICSTIPPMMIQLRKCGRYSSVWETFLKGTLLSSFSMIARIIGTGNPAIKPIKFSHRVFLSATGKSGMLITNLKLSSPTHLLPHMPLNMLYFWNAIIRPIIGL